MPQGQTGGKDARLRGYLAAKLLSKVVKGILSRCALAPQPCDETGKKLATTVMVIAGGIGPRLDRAVDYEFALALGHVVFHDLQQVSQFELALEPGLLTKTEAAID